ncbi:MAG TPA: hypothetical protein PLS90_00720 [Candidatus Sumerlaeota bacterium]|nr:hypothetical protein [Candidatus Sumerlaeota bacterium]HPK00955.1 hypothetical protein [Candidatus Sumerlaeota bacterium]
MARRDVPPPYPRDKEELIRDFTVAGRLRDIRDSVRLRDQLMPRWWEAGVGVLQFGAALGLLASLVQYAGLREDPMGHFIVFWFILTLLSLVLGFEFLILRLHQMRRAHVVALRLIEKLDERIAALEGDAREQEGAQETSR